MNADQIMRLVHAYGLACIDYAVSTRNHAFYHDERDAAEAHAHAERAGEARRAIESALASFTPDEA